MVLAASMVLAVVAEGVVVVWVVVGGGISRHFWRVMPCRVVRNVQTSACRACLLSLLVSWGQLGLTPGLGGGFGLTPGLVRSTALQGRSCVQALRRLSIFCGGRNYGLFFFVKK